MRIHSFGLTSAEEALFQKILRNDPQKTASAIIRERIFGRRNRNQITAPLVDIVFLSQVSNLLDALRDNLQRGKPVDTELEELRNLVSSQIQQQHEDPAV